MALGLISLEEPEYTSVLQGTPMNEVLQSDFLETLVMPQVYK